MAFKHFLFSLILDCFPREKKADLEKATSQTLRLKGNTIKKLTVRLKGRMNYSVSHSLPSSWDLANWVALMLSSLTCI